MSAGKYFMDKDAHERWTQYLEEEKIRIEEEKRKRKEEELNQEVNLCDSWVMSELDEYGMNIESFSLKDVFKDKRAGKIYVPKEWISAQQFESDEDGIYIERDLTSDDGQIMHLCEFYPWNYFYPISGKVLRNFDFGNCSEKNQK